MLLVKQGGKNSKHQLSICLPTSVKKDILDSKMPNKSIYRKLIKQIRDSFEIILESTWIVTL